MSARVREISTAHADPAAVAAAIGRLSEFWGSHGYRITGIDSPVMGGARLHVVAGDGSRFLVAVDRWGVALPECEGDL